MLLVKLKLVDGCSWDSCIFEKEFNNKKELDEYIEKQNKDMFDAYILNIEEVKK